MRKIVTVSVVAGGLLLVIIGAYLYAEHLWRHKNSDVYAIILVVAGALLIFVSISESGELGWKSFFIRFAKAPERVQVIDPLLTSDQWTLLEHLKYGTRTGQSYEKTIAEKLGWSKEKVAEEAEVLRRYGLATWRPKNDEQLWSSTHKGDQASRPRTQR